MFSQTAPTVLAKEARIGIVGAGASGLTTAHYLAEAGYENITLFERRQRAGGKCESITVDGRVYEMGAVLGAANYTVIRDLTRRVELDEGRCTPNHWYTPSGQRTPLFDRLLLPLLLWQLGAKYLWLTASKYRAARQPGLSGTHPHLHENFQTFAERHGLGELPAGFYEKLEALQGERHTFYCGEIMSFSILECCARYARQLVERFFAGGEAEPAPAVQVHLPASLPPSS